VAPRAYWKGYLRLSLVSCPIALFPATSEREKVSFHQINRATGNRIRYRKVDAETGEEVPSDQIIKGYEVAKGEYVEISDEELESIALESTKTIEIDEFVPRSEIDDLYNVRPYYIAPDGKVGQDAFVVIRSIIEQMKMVAVGRVVLTSREHVMAMEPRGKGLMGTLLRYPYEVRDEKEFFDDIPNVKLTKDMMDLARHIVETKTGHFKPAEFEDHYEHALKELIAKKSKGEKIEIPKEQPTGKVINLMDALRRSVQAEAQSGRPPAAKKGRKAAAGQKEMLLPIAGRTTQEGGLTGGWAPATAPYPPLVPTAGQQAGRVTSFAVVLPHCRLSIDADDRLAGRGPGRGRCGPSGSHVRRSRRRGAGATRECASVRRRCHRARGGGPYCRRSHFRS
jgi:DNA end-binding protein Ku